MQDNLDKYGERFAHRILTENEYNRYQSHAHPAAFLAKRFAAKEAAAKALGTGFRDGLSLKHIEVTNNELGKPELCFHERATDYIKKMGIANAYLSLSDEQDYAVAYVILTKVEETNLVEV
jgi:holo-[acyl-carrier protein] synthase